MFGRQELRYESLQACWMEITGAKVPVTIRICTKNNRFYTEVPFQYSTKLLPTTTPPPHVSQEYFDGDEVDHSSEPPSAKGLAVFRDPNAVNGIKRTATSINWHPDGPTKIAVSYRFVASSSRLLVWPAANKSFLVGLHQKSEWRGNPGRS